MLNVVEVFGTVWKVKQFDFIKIVNILILFLLFLKP